MFQNETLQMHLILNEKQERTLEDVAKIGRWFKDREHEDVRFGKIVESFKERIIEKLRIVTEDFTNKVIDLQHNIKRINNQVWKKG
jgi:hypothetical protein